MNLEYSYKNNSCNVCELYYNKNNIDYNKIFLCNTCINYFNVCKNITKKQNNIIFNNIKNPIYINSKTFEKIKSSIIKKRNITSIEYNQLQRKQQLFKILKEYKLEYKKNSICDIFIKYGIPKLQDVINVLEKENINTISNLKLLSKELTKLNLKFDKKLPSHFNYIKNGGNINKTIEIGKIENIIINSTEYLEYLKKYSNEDALDMACIEYIDLKGQNEIISNYLDKILTLKFS